MRRDAIVKFSDAIRDVLESDAVLSVHPDHPFLFSAPDVLIGYRGKLSALFFVKAIETRRPKELAARLIAARLALPAHTSCHVMLQHGATSDNPLYSNFDGVLEAHKTAEYIRLFNSSDGPEPARARELAEARNEAYIRYSSLLHIQRSKRVFIAPTAVAFTGEDWRGSIGVPWHGSQRIRMHNGSLVGLKNTETRRNLQAALHEYSIQSFNENFWLNDGIPEIKRFQLDVASLDAPSTYGLDPEKPLRVAAFSGWALTPTEYLHDIDAFLETESLNLERTYERINFISTRRRAR